MSNIERVLSFIAKWEERDVEGIVESFIDSGVYHNMPMEPIAGKEDIRAFVTEFLSTVCDAEWEVIHIVEGEGGVVLTERVDSFEYGKGKKVSIPVMGTFEFSGDKIAKWRDYFDLASFTSQMKKLRED